MKTTKTCLETWLESVKNDLVELQESRLSCTEGVEFKKKIDKKILNLQKIQRALFDILDLD